MPYTSREVYEFISRQTNDPIVERKTCAVSGQPFAIYQSDLDFYAKISSAFAGQRFQIPTPTLCPEERQRRRLLFRNERKLYKRKCDATGETIISIYSPDKPYKVYKQDFWWSDKWDPMEYGRDFDFSKNFLDNFSKLFSIFPRLGVQLINCENCDYSNIATSAKNCYLSSVNSRSEDVHYSSWVVHSQNTIDSYKCGYVNNCYNCINCNDCSFLKRCLYCSNSNHCYSSTNLE